MKMVKFGAKPKHRTYEEFKKAAEEYKKKKKAGEKMRFHYHEEPIEPIVYWRLSGAVIGVALAFIFQFVIP